MFVTTLGMDNFDGTKMNAHFEKFTACLWEEAHSQVEASFTSPTSPPYVAKQLMALSTHSFFVYCIVVPTIYCPF